MAHPGGRPRKKFDLKQIEGFGVRGCSFEEMAALLDVSVSTISEHMNALDSKFSKAYKKGYAQCRHNLRSTD